MPRHRIDVQKYKNMKNLYYLSCVILACMFICCSDDYEDDTRFKPVDYPDSVFIDRNKYLKINTTISHDSFVETVSGAEGWQLHTSIGYDENGIRESSTESELGVLYVILKFGAQNEFWYRGHPSSQLNEFHAGEYSLDGDSLHLEASFWDDVYKESFKVIAYNHDWLVLELSGDKSGKPYRYTFERKEYISPQH